MLEPGHAAFTVLHMAALVISLLALGVAGAAWWLSRAKQIREFEGRVYGQLTNANARIESIEAKWAEQLLRMETLSEEIDRGIDRTTRERKRLGSENTRADLRLQEVGAGNGLDTSLSREDQLRQVRGLLHG